MNIDHCRLKFQECASALVSPRAVIALGVLVLVASVVSGRERPETSAPAGAAPVQTDAAGASATEVSATEALPGLDLERLRRPEAAVTVTNLFAPAQLEPPVRQAAGPAPQPPAPPEAPPLPFKYLGQMLEDGRQSIFLARGVEHFNVKAGQMIDGEYRVESIAANEIAITYLPLRAKQTLAIPAIE